MYLSNLSEFFSMSITSKNFEDFVSGSFKNRLLPSSFFLLAGDPPPQVTWWRDSHLIDSSYEGSYSRTVQNGLRLHNVSRAELGAQLTCQASNNNLSLPVSNRVTIDMKCEWVGGDQL